MIITTKIASIIADKNGIEEGEITAESDFTNDLGMDSLDLVELVLELENEFNIEISDSDAENIHTVAVAVEHVDRKIYKQNLMTYLD